MQPKKRKLGSLKKCKQRNLFQHLGIFIMAGLLVLLGLFIWIAITIFAIKAGYKLFKRFFQSKRLHFFGAFLGFMLTMGGFFVKWSWEYWEIKRYTDKMCSHAGLRIFVTSKKWKEMVGGEDAWKAMPYINELVDNKPPYPNYLVFENEGYKMVWQANDRIFTYRYYKPRKFNTRMIKKIYYDVVSKKILAQSIEIFPSHSSMQYLGLDFWREMPDCSNNPRDIWLDSYVANIPFIGANYE